MRLRLELVIGTALAAALGIGAAALGARRARVTDVDPRRSTFLSGPSGALGYAQALERLGVRVERFRRPPEELHRVLGDTVSTVVAVLAPARELTVRDAKLLIELPADLLLAGRGVTRALECLGYGRRGMDVDTAEVSFVLEARRTRTVVDSSGVEDGVTVECRGPAPVAVDTLFRRPGGAVALRLHYSDNRTITIVADGRLFSNASLRTTEAGPFALGLVVPRYDRALVDEYHQGFAVSGSVTGALFDWSLRSPWGWAAWQLAIVGIIALLAAGVRFGPVQRPLERRRRSPLEHVRALATALAAAHGHAVAVELMVRGLRRRLSRAGHPAREASQAWLDGLVDVVRTADGRRRLEALRDLTGRPAGAEDVRQAAHAVEDVWEALTTKSRATPLPPRPS